MERQNIILMDSDEFEGEEFRQAIERVTGNAWKIIVRHCNVPQNKYENLIRYFKYIFVPLDVCIKRKNYDDIIAWQQFFGIFFAFWCELFHIKKCNKVYVMMLIYNEKKGWKGKIYRWLYYKALHSTYIEFFTCAAEKEREEYIQKFDLSDDRIIYVPWGITDYSKYYETTPSDDKYILSAGRSNRDWDFLISSLQDTSYSVKIVSSENMRDLPNNFELFTNISRDSYFKLLAKAYCVVIAVDNPVISSGQLALIEALQFGKPVVATKSEGLTSNYMKADNSGIVIEKNKSELIEALEKLFTQTHEYNLIKNKGRQYYEKQLSNSRMGLDIAKAILKHCGDSHG